MSFKETIKAVRKELRETFKDYKVSVREQQGGYNYCMYVHINNKDGSPVTKEILKQATEIADRRNNANDTDIMTDYFNYDYYAIVQSY